jgi:hypothetical protein
MGSRAVSGRRARSDKGGDYSTPGASRAQQGLVFRDLQGTRRAGRNRLAYCRCTGSLLVNNKLSVNDLEHSREAFDTVSRVDTHCGIVCHFHGSPSYW